MATGHYFSQGTETQMEVIAYLLNGKPTDNWDEEVQIESF